MKEKRYLLRAIHSAFTFHAQCTKHTLFSITKMIFFTIINLILIEHNVLFLYLNRVSVVYLQCLRGCNIETYFPHVSV